jgi:hypothetical protein
MSAVTVRSASSDLISAGLLLDGPSEVRLVTPDAVPEGAVVLGLVVALPGGADRTSRPVRQLVAVPADPRTAGQVTPTNPVDGNRHGNVDGNHDGDPGRDGLLVCGTGLVVDRWGRRVLRDGHEVRLTRREFELLEHLVAHPGRVFTRDQLMTAVWDFADPRYAPARTVDVHVSRLRRKLGAAHSAPLESLRGVGYRWAGRPTPVGGAS